MPYSSISDLPDNVTNVLPKHAQEIFKEALAPTMNIKIPKIGEVMTTGRMLRVK